MENIDHLIRKVVKYVTFGQPVSQGSVVSQRISDPRIPILAFYLSLQQIDEKEQYYHEIWLKKEGMFAITEAWYRGSNVTRKLLKDHLNFEQLRTEFGEEIANNVGLRITEIIKKSERADWSSGSGKSRA
ncbi:hypothetical protein [Paenibacillus thalictri]|uniref:Uncharacterized protein n=1 Tax=Paenibacillus thalictri TaxID=2527873 RepID=A0A4Q9DKK7_9BACL|nr:hypothetical protein [Paenibacillus thalictri]TBL71371.1 hypothetical protein EYB31_30230 [Paenibacillus thalictri]